MFDLSAIAVEDDDRRGGKRVAVGGTENRGVFGAGSDAALERECGVGFGVVESVSESGRGRGCARVGVDDPLVWTTVSAEDASGNLVLAPPVKLVGSRAADDRVVSRAADDGVVGGSADEEAAAVAGCDIAALGADPDGVVAVAKGDGARGVDVSLPSPVVIVS